MRGGWSSRSSAAFTASTAGRGGGGGPTTPPPGLGPGPPPARGGAAEPLTVAEAWAAAPGWIIRFREIPTRNAAAAYLSVYLEADPGIVPPLRRGSYYWHELRGCPVVDPH